MDALSYKTQYATPRSFQPKWFVIDATDVPLGRLASFIAYRLRGKQYPFYSPNIVCGDKIIVINAEKVRLTGNKWNQKEIIRHTGYPGGQRRPTAEMVLHKDPRKLIEVAVKGMLPKTILGGDMFRNLNVYVGPTHRHNQQQPQALTVPFNKA